MDQRDFFSSRHSGDDPPGDGDIVRGRYRLPDPRTGQVRDWTRVTTLAETLDDNFALNRWQLYQLLRGLRMRPDLVLRVQALDLDDERHKVDLREIVAEADSAAASGAKANVGTAIHGALALADRGKAFDPVFDRYVTAYRDELRRCRLAVVPGMVEVRLCNTDLDTVGTGDRFVQCLSTGRVMVADVKSGRLEFGNLSFAQQFGTYASSDYFDAGEGYGWQPLTGVDLEHAVAIHVDPESAGVSVYDVDIRAGRQYAVMSRRVREARRDRTLFMPYVAGPATPSTQAPGDLGYSTGVAPTADPPRHLAAVPDPGTMAASGGLVNGGAPDPFRPGPSQDVPVGPEHVDHPQDVHDRIQAATGLPTDQVAKVIEQFTPPVDPEVEAKELERLTKRELEHYCGQLGIEDVKHHKIHLARAIVAKRNELRAVGAALPTGQDAPPVAASSRESKADASARDAAFVKLERDRRQAEALTSIREAKTVGQLGQLWQEVVREGGDQAWTPSLDAASKARAAELDAQAATAPSLPQRDEPDPLAMIGQAANQEDLARIWEVVTVGGTHEDRWTPAVAAASMVRLVAIQAESAKVVAPNPFAPAGA